MTSFARYYENKKIYEFTMDDIENLIKNEENKKLIGELIYQRYYNRFLKIFFYKSKLEYDYFQKIDGYEQVKTQNEFNTEYKNGFVIMTSCCLLIETMAAFFNGSNETKNNGNETFNSIFRQSEKYNNDLKIFLNEPFYKNIRCSLLHQGETYGKFKIRRDGILFDKVSKTINAKLFCDSLNDFLISYKEELEVERWDSSLWDNCRSKLRYIIKNSK